MEGSKPFIVIDIFPSVRRGRKPRWIVGYYVSGDRTQRFCCLRHYGFAGQLLLYLQPVIGKQVFTRETMILKPDGKTYPRLRIFFMGGAERLAQLYMHYLLAATNTWSRRKAEKLAHCLAIIDPFSPVLDLFNKSLELMGYRKHRRILQAYCGVR